MKPSKLLRWVVMGSVGALAACGGGVSSIGKGDGDDKGGTNGGFGASASTGGSSSGPSSKGGSGATSNGMGGAPSPQECNLDGDCTQYDLPCQVCADGSKACGEMFCIGGQCIPQMLACNAECRTDMDCPVPDIACTMCEDGTTQCPTSTCTSGKCKTTFPTCGGNYCDGKACGAPCPTTVCRPETCDPIENSYCDGKGTCQMGVPECASGELCSTAKDCPPAPPNCVPCDGSTCAGMDCLLNKCVFTCPANPNPECKTNEDCPVIDNCKKPVCAGAPTCGVNVCLQNTCTVACLL